MYKTKLQKIDPRQVLQFLADAEKKAIAARKNLKIDMETAYQIAYEAMLKASLALMLSHGQRPRIQLGHHIAIIEFAEKHLDLIFPAPLLCLIACVENETMLSTTSRSSVTRKQKKPSLLPKDI
jgi:hypothetical protein